MPEWVTGPQNHVKFVSNPTRSIPLLELLCLLVAKLKSDLFLRFIEISSYYFTKYDQGCSIICLITPDNHDVSLNCYLSKTFTNKIHSGEKG